LRPFFDNFKNQKFSYLIFERKNSIFSYLKKKCSQTSFFLKNLEFFLSKITYFSYPSKNNTNKEQSFYKLLYVFLSFDELCADHSIPVCSYFNDILFVLKMLQKVKKSGGFDKNWLLLVFWIQKCESERKFCVFFKMVRLLILVWFFECIFESSKFSGNFR
jgi:hypothetical protein